MPPPVYEATGSTFDALVFAPRGELVVVDFWAEGCPHCDVFAQDVPALLQALGEARVRVVRVDASTHEEVARRFGLFGVPTFLLVRDGKVQGRMSRYDGREPWLAVVRAHLPKPPWGERPPHAPSSEDSV